jgi:streptogramin lyase
MRLYPYISALFLNLACSSDTPAPNNSAPPGTPDAALTKGGSCPSSVTPADGGAPQADTIQIPGGETGIGFDDLIYSAELHRMIVPGGWTGSVNLVNPDTLEVTSISGFSSEASWDGNDTKGVGCVDHGNGLVFVGDRTTGEVGVVDPKEQKIVTKVTLEGYPDYIRYVEATGELWVTEPFKGQIEVLTGARDGNPVHDASLPLSPDDSNSADGPQALVIDQKRGLAFTMHLFRGQIVAFDVKTRKEIGTWPTGCGSSHGLVAVDEDRGYVFPGCLEKASINAVAPASEGAVLDSFDLGTGETLVAFSPKLSHAYAHGDPGKSIAILGVSNGGKLSHFSTFEMTFGLPQKGFKGHCLAADDQGGVWACDAYSGTILRYKDTFPSCFD